VILYFSSYQLSADRKRVTDTWQERQDYLLQCFDLERFQNEAKILEENLDSIEKATNAITTLAESTDALRLAVTEVNTIEF